MTLKSAITHIELMNRFRLSKTDKWYPTTSRERPTSGSILRDHSKNRKKRIDLSSKSKAVQKIILLSTIRISIYSLQGTRS